MPICFVNLLTVLAWLDQIKYQGEADLHLVGDKFEHIESYSLAVDGHEALYKQVLLHKENPKHITPSPLKTGVELYLNYMKQDSDLMLYIQQHQHVPDKDLISLLLKNFKKYGLGDTQYEILIKMNRGFNR